LKIRYLGLAQRAKARCVFLVLEVSFKALSNHSPGADHYPRNAESGDRPYQLCARSVSVRGDAEVETFAVSDVMPGVMKLVFEVDQVDVHLHGHLQTKEELLIRAALLFLLNVFIGLLLDQLYLAI
jgi:hypothetical protein